MERNLKEFNSKLAEEWHPTKNGNETPSDISPYSHKTIWWLCDKKHEWEATVGNRQKGRGCPYCAKKLPSEEYNLKVISPELDEQWDYKKNDKLPTDVLPHSKYRAFWRCKECKFEWEDTVANRYRNKGTRGCPKCESIYGAHPSLKKLWHNQMNLPTMPIEVHKKYGKKCYWKCRQIECNYNWEATPNSVEKELLKGYNPCPKCKERIKNSNKKSNSLVNDKKQKKKLRIMKKNQ